MRSPRPTIARAEFRGASLQRRGQRLRLRQRRVFVLLRQSGQLLYGVGRLSGRLADLVSLVGGKEPHQAAFEIVPIANHVFELVVETAAAVDRRGGLKRQLPVRGISVGQLLRGGVRGREVRASAAGFSLLLANADFLQSLPQLHGGGRLSRRDIAKRPALLVAQGQFQQLAPQSRVGRRQKRDRFPPLRLDQPSEEQLGRSTVRKAFWPLAAADFLDGRAGESV